MIYHRISVPNISNFIYFAITALLTINCVNIAFHSAVVKVIYISAFVS